VNLLSEMEQLFQDFKEAQEQLIEELKVTQPEYAEKMIRRLDKKSSHYAAIIKDQKEML
jgi:predicted TPR repeat methyltransferase